MKAKVRIFLQAAKVSGGERTEDESTFRSPPEILWSFLKFGFIFIPAANFVKTWILSSSQTTQTLSGKGEVVGEATDGQ